MPVFRKGFEPPKGNSRYFKPTEGREHEIRIIGPSSEGYEAWSTDDGKRTPHRKPGEPFTDEELQNIGAEADRYDNIQQMYVAVPIIDRADGKTKLWQIRQGGVMGSLQSLEENKRWGDLTEYDICVTHTIEGDRHKYGVLPLSKSPLTAADRKLIADNPVNCAALFSGGDPFDAANNGHAPKSSFTAAQATPAESRVLLSGIIKPTPPQTRYGVKDADGKVYGTANIALVNQAESFMEAGQSVLVGFTTQQAKDGRAIYNLTSVTAAPPQQTEPGQDLEEDIPFNQAPQGAGLVGANHPGVGESF